MNAGLNTKTPIVRPRISAVYASCTYNRNSTFRRSNASACAIRLFRSTFVNVFCVIGEKSTRRLLSARIRRRKTVRTHGWTAIASWLHCTGRHAAPAAGNTMVGTGHVVVLVMWFYRLMVSAVETTAKRVALKREEVGPTGYDPGVWPRRRRSSRARNGAVHRCKSSYVKSAVYIQFAIFQMDQDKGWVSKITSKCFYRNRRLCIPPHRMKVIKIKCCKSEA